MVTNVSGAASAAAAELRFAYSVRMMSSRSICSYKRAARKSGEARRPRRAPHTHLHAQVAAAAGAHYAIGAVVDFDPIHNFHHSESKTGEGCGGKPVGADGVPPSSAAGTRPGIIDALAASGPGIRRATGRFHDLALVHLFGHVAHGAAKAEARVQAVPEPERLGTTFAHTSGELAGYGVRKRHCDRGPAMTREEQVSVHRQYRLPDKDRGMRTAALRTQLSCVIQQGRRRARGGCLRGGKVGRIGALSGMNAASRRRASQPEGARAHVRTRNAP